MKIVALFGLRNYEQFDHPELLTAWDEYSVDENPEGWLDAKAEAIADIEGDLLTSAEITIDVSESSILSILRPMGAIKGTVRV